MAEFIETKVSDKYSNTEYNLLSNICHDGTPTTGTYSTHLHLSRYVLTWSYSIICSSDVPSGDANENFEIFLGFCPLSK